MKKDVTIKDIIFCTVLAFLIAGFIAYNVKPIESKLLDDIFKKIRMQNAAQNIAPERLFISAWRIIKSEYVNTDMNGQDWRKWRYRYSGKIKTFDDAKLAIDTMIASLNDSYTRFLTSSSYSKQKNILASQITVTIERDGKFGSKIVEQKDIPVNTMKYEVTDDIGVIRLDNIMGKKAIDDFISIIKNSNDKKAIIIDLRDNYGGIIGNSIEMANFMLDDEKIVSIKEANNKSYSLYANNENMFKDKPIIILVNKKTASAAELLAGCLKTNRNAILIGDYTYGKNSIQQVIPMHNKTGLIITTAKYILPSGEDIHNVGIEPDIFMKNAKKEDVMKKALKLADEMVKNKK